MMSGRFRTYFKKTMVPRVPVVRGNRLLIVYKPHIFAYRTDIITC